MYASVDSLSHKIHVTRTMKCYKLPRSFIDFSSVLFHSKYFIILFLDTDRNQCHPSSNQDILMHTFMAGCEDLHINRGVMRRPDRK